MKKISIIVPVYNEEAVIEKFLNQQLIPEINKITTYQFSIVLINDGSKDKTLEILQKFTTKDKKIKVISFSRNFGKEVALAAGMNYAKSADAVIMIDSDGQQPPKLIPKFIAKWEKGAEIVTGVRSRFTKHGLIQRTGSKVFYWLLNRLGDTDTVPGSTDFRLIDKVVVAEYNKLTEHNRITRGLIDWLGFRQEQIEYVYGERMAGEPSYNLKKLIKLAIDSIVSMTTRPLLILGFFGIFLIIITSLLLLFWLFEQVLFNDPLSLNWDGLTILGIFTTFLAGMILLSQMIMALYISHVHSETQNRPLYIIDEKNSRNL
ncbi:MAG: glycosyltransferase family 2 protein [Candidatus Saccharibacteria bacterium]|nr:glycosyltransferase family 2 protein [Candidatus Saccharibacteria bacterium]